MKPATLVMEEPYSEFDYQSYQKDGWLSEMDFICDGDREVAIVICTDDEIKLDYGLKTVEYDKLENINV